MPSPADRLPKRELDALALFARDMAHEAGDVLRRGSSRPRNVSKKGKIDLVTNVDLASESLIVGRIKKRFPEHGILAEENTSKKTESPFRWLIDPLDGTVNFAHGYPHFCVSIALEYRNATRVGVVFDPLRNEMFSAALGRGARLNSRRIQITTPARLVDALCATGFPYDTHTSPKNNLANFGRIMKRAQDIRRGGSAAL
ncbi:MAG: inositol monophosphatase family protein, partial [Candidatus Zixiibacteriota bacterium]